jgi:hypothetical protein
MLLRVLLETVLATGIFFGLYGAADAVRFCFQFPVFFFFLSFAVLLRYSSLQPFETHLSLSLSPLEQNNTTTVSEKSPVPRRVG